MDIIERVSQAFTRQFQSQPLIVRSPGRVNLIGEHTDYNEGFVLPAAIDKAIYVAIAPRTDEQFTLVAVDLDKTFTGKLSHLEKGQGWADYLMGVVDELQKAGHTLRGFNCAFGGDIPIGAGLSSSAALECSLAFALNEVFGLGIDRMALVKLAQRAENDFVGMKCGIMDQFASVFGKKNHAMQLDCRSLEFSYYPIRMQGYRLLLCDSRVHHSLASSEYNTRREQCEEGVRILRQHYPEIRSLRDVRMEMLTQHLQTSRPLLYNRCAYVVEENSRLLAACEALQRGDLDMFGRQMYLSHYGLRDMYEVSCTELDFLVAFTETEDAVLGSRMTGGGFGGCTINLIREAAVSDFSERITRAYRESMGRELKIYTANIEDGTGVVRRE